MAKKRRRGGLTNNQLLLSLAAVAAAGGFWWWSEKQKAANNALLQQTLSTNNALNIGEQDATIDGGIVGGQITSTTGMTPPIAARPVVQQSTALSNALAASRLTRTANQSAASSPGLGLIR